MDSAWYDMGFVGSQKGMLLYDIRNVSNPTLSWDSRPILQQKANNQTVAKDDDMSINKQICKIKCFPRGGGFVVGGVDGRCWIKV